MSALLIIIALCAVIQYRGFVIAAVLLMLPSSVLERMKDKAQDPDWVNVYERILERRS